MNTKCKPNVMDIKLSQENKIKSKKNCINFKSKKRKFEDIFCGFTECQLLKRTLPDYLSHNLDILIIGINPGYTAAAKGHHYSGPGNHFWKCLYLSQLISEPLNAFDDYKLLNYGSNYRIGFTNIVQRTTRGSDCLTKNEIREGSIILMNKLITYAPKVAVFNGKGIYEIFSGATDFNLGLQPNPIKDTNTFLYVMPSSSARCSQLPRAIDKLPFYTGLKKLLDNIRDQTKPINSKEYVFPKLRSPVKRNRNESSNDLPRDGESECSNFKVEHCLLSGNNMLTATKVSGNEHKLMNTTHDSTIVKKSNNKLCFKDEKMIDSKVSLLNFSSSLITSHYFNN